MPTKTIKDCTVADAYLEILADRGVEYLFANAGTDFAPLIEALANFRTAGRAAPAALAVPHENLAMAMAHGHAMISGRPQAVMVHVNVGTANAVCGLFNAARDNIPMLLAAGRTPLTEAGPHGARNRHIHWAQEMFDQGSLVREAVKWDYELRRGDQLETVVDRALNLAMNQPRGPVYLTLPREVLAEPFTGFQGIGRSARGAASPPSPDATALAEAAELLGRAENPLIITAGVGRDPAAVPELAALAERFAIPVVPFMARFVCLPSDHPMHLGFQPGPLLSQADVVLVVDCDVPWFPGPDGPPDGCKLIHMSADPLFANYPIRNFPCDLAITADPAAGLPLLAEAMAGQGQGIEARRERLAVQREEQRAGRRAALERAAGEAPMAHAWVTHCIDQAKDDDAIVINELGLAPPFIAFDRPGAYFGPSPAGGLGQGLGAALGAKLAAPDRQVIAAVGDGSYMFGNPTPAHFVSEAHGLPVLYVVFNDSGWSAVRNATRDMYPEGGAMQSNQPPLTALEPSPAFERVVEASGGYGERVEDPAEMPAAMERALGVVRDEGRQALLNVICRHR